MRFAQSHFPANPPGPPPVDRMLFAVFMHRNPQHTGVLTDRIAHRSSGAVQVRESTGAGSSVRSPLRDGPNVSMDRVP